MPEETLLSVRQLKALENITEICSAFEELRIHRVDGALPYLKGALERLSVIDADLAAKKEQLKDADEIKKLADAVPALYGVVN